MERPRRLVTESPVPMLNILLREMNNVAAYKRFPFRNDLGWTDEDFDHELSEDLTFLRFMLGLPLRQPVMPRDDSSPDVGSFLGFPPPLNRPEPSDSAPSIPKKYG